MSALYAARGSRQTAVLTAIIGLHVGALYLIATGLAPRIFAEIVNAPPPIVFVRSQPQEPVAVKPEVTMPDDPVYTRVPKPDVRLPDFAQRETMPSREQTEPATEGNGAAIPAPSHDSPPALRTRDQRLAALIDACYPSASRRLGEEGRAVAHVTIGTRGRAIEWRIAQSSGFARLDEAVGCVIGRLEFVAGRREGQTVEAEAAIPFVFRLQ
jgi:protein TonB